MVETTTLLRTRRLYAPHCPLLGVVFCMGCSGPAVLYILPEHLKDLSLSAFMRYRKTFLFASY